MENKPLQQAQSSVDDFVAIAIEPKEPEQAVQEAAVEVSPPEMLPPDMELPPLDAYYNDVPSDLESMGFHNPDHALDATPMSEPTSAPQSEAPLNQAAPEPLSAMQNDTATGAPEEPNEPYYHQNSPSQLTSQYTLAQLAGVEPVEEGSEADLELARLHLFRDLKHYNQVDALKNLTDSTIINGTLGDRAELAGEAIAAAIKSSQRFVSQTLSITHETFLEKSGELSDNIAKYADYQKIYEKDPDLANSLLSYTKSQEGALSNNLLEFAREQNTAFIHEQFKHHNPVRVSELASHQKACITLLSGTEFKEHLASAAVFGDIVKSDLKNGALSEDYSAISLAARGNFDYLKSLNQVLMKEFDNRPDKKVTKKEFLEQRLSEINATIPNAQDRLNLVEKTSKNGKSFYEIGVKFDKSLSEKANIHISNMLNGKDNPEKVSKAEKNQEATQEEILKEQQAQRHQRLPQGPFYFSSIYYGAKGFVSGLFDVAKQGVENKQGIGEFIKNSYNFAAEKTKAGIVASKAFLEDNAPIVKEKAAEFKDKFQQVKDNPSALADAFYHKRAKIDAMETSIYKPVYNSDGLNISPRLRAFEFGQEMQKMQEYTQAMKGVMLNGRNAPIVADKLHRFSGIFNNTINHLSEPHKPTYAEYKLEMPAKLEAKQHAIRVLGDYQELTKQVSKNRLNGANTQEYDELSKRSLGMVQNLALTTPATSNSERLAADIYKDSLFLKHYSTELSNRKSLGLKTDEIERRIEKRLTQIEGNQVQLKKAMSGPYIGDSRSENEVKISLSKTSEYLELSKQLQDMAFKEKAMLERGEKFKKEAKEREFSLESLTQGLQEAFQKILSSLNFGRKSNGMGV